jgi:hypothetical protein
MKQSLLVLSYPRLVSSQMISPSSCWVMIYDRKVTQ